MPTARVKFIVRPAVAGGLATFRSLVEAELQQYPNWRAHVDATDLDEIGPYRVAELVFAQRAHATAFRQWFADNLTTIRAQVNGVVKGYLCSHEDPEVFSCADDPRSQYQEVRL